MKPHPLQVPVSASVALSLGRLSMDVRRGVVIVWGVEPLEEGGVSPTALWVGWKVDTPTNQLNKTRTFLLWVWYNEGLMGWIRS